MTLRKLIIFSLLPLLTLSSTFHPQDNYLLTFSPSKNLTSTHFISPTSPPHTSTHAFSFSFPLSSHGPHILRLHFHPLSTPTSLFNIHVSNFSLLSDFSPAQTTTTIKEFFFFNINLQTLTLLFSPLSNKHAYVNAIELYSTPNDNLFQGYVRGNNHAESSLDHGRVLEALYRVNVGGPLVAAENDTLWRVWVPDDRFLEGRRKGDPVTFGGRIRYPDGGATKETAPESVYGTAREMGSRGNTSTDIFNLTWVFPVSNSSDGCLVRLHFCDIVSKALYELYFDIYINNYTASKDLDLSSQSQSLASPYYIDFIVNSNPSGNIRISVSPSNRTLSWKMNAILNGIEIMKIHGIAEFSEPAKKKNYIKVLMWSILGGFVSLCLLSVFLVVLLWRRRRKKVEKKKPLILGSSHSRMTEISTSNLNLSLRIGFSEILLATNNFDEESIIGFGGFGKVYRGKLRDGTAIAVKRGHSDDGSGNNGDGSRQGLNEFQSEISVLTNIRHRHLVSLIGYCHERSEMILVYEFVSNGSLRDNLYGSKRHHLSWKRRLEICIGSARGLHYLHTGTNHDMIIHRDVKSSNILLDDDYNAKVADFGLSRSAGSNIDGVHVSTGVKGSFGYLDPEYFKTQKLTDKSDVYSFGVVLLEVLCARPVIDRDLSWEEVNLAEWGMKWQKKGKLKKIIDTSLQNGIDDKSLKKFGETAEKCLAKYGEDRPTMGDVLWNLECVLQLHESATRETLQGICTDSSQS